MTKKVITLESRFGTTELVKDRIQAFYAKLNYELRELEVYKKKRGICTAGISCMKRSVKGNACAHHAAAKKAGIRLRRWQAYETEYGKLRKREREQRHSKPSAKTKRKTERKAA
jgi:hypothetical protein